MLQSLLFFANDALQRAANNSPPLARGNQGDAVRCLQLGLHALGFLMPLSIKTNPLSADGIFGNETDAAVRLFQQRHALGVDGIAGRQTLSRLDHLMTHMNKDPLAGAVRDLASIGLGLVKAGGNEPAARLAFGKRLVEADRLVLGDTRKLDLRLKAQPRLA
jgi:murein L,D-transpeptidase YcbB/YkuD